MGSMAAGWPGWSREQVFEQSEAWVSPWRPAAAVTAVIDGYEMYVVDGTEATLVTYPAHGGDVVGGALHAARWCGASCVRLTIGPDYLGAGAIIDELTVRGAELVSKDDILAADIATATLGPPDPGVDVVEVSTVTDATAFERISARGWNYPEPTTSDIDDAYARLTRGWFLAPCEGHAAGNCRVRPGRHGSSLLGGGSHPADARPRGIPRPGGPASGRGARPRCDARTGACRPDVLAHLATTGFHEIRRASHVPRGDRPMSGRSLPPGEIDNLWDAWTPHEVSRRLATVAAPWCVVAGWALELFTAAAARAHHDLEIAVPAPRFDEIMDALPGVEWDVTGDGRIWPFPQQRADHFQTWLREPETGLYRLDVFREPTSAGRWVCRRDTSISLSYDELILRSPDGVPYVVPEVALLFKAKHLRPKDQIDFRAVLPSMPHMRRTRLHGWFSRIHPGHPWIDALDAES